ncbi:MAG: RNA recognition motif domain-containing protein [Ignavibacteriales bacterium]
MTKTLYFGNLSYDVDETTLSNAVSQYGRVITARVAADRDTGQSRGFGFVEVDDQDAQKVIDAMNGMEWYGRQLTVNEARERQDRGGARGDFRGQRGYR